MRETAKRFILHLTILHVIKRDFAFAFSKVSLAPFESHFHVILLSSSMFTLKIFHATKQ